MGRKIILCILLIVLTVLLLYGVKYLQPRGTQPGTSTKIETSSNTVADEKTGTDTESSSESEQILSNKEIEAEDEEPIDEDFVLVTEYIPDIYVDLKYATTDNFTGQIIYDFEDVYLRYGTLKKLKLVQETLEDYGYSLKIWDAYRPVRAQFKLWEVCPNPTYVANPNTGYSSHSKGNTIDVTLVKLGGYNVEMPTGFDDFSAKADRDYSDVSASAAENAKFLERVMKEHGFEMYSGEWWHFSDTTDYAVANDLTESGNMWLVDCDEYISMRKTPTYAGTVIQTIPKGSSVELLGFESAFAKIKYRGTTGFVLANYIMAGNGGFKHELQIVRPQGDYTYEQMTGDIKKLAEKYSAELTTGSIGKSEYGRDIPVILFGNRNAQYQVLIQCAIHAREHMTSSLVMCILEYTLANSEKIFEDGITIEEALENVCFHIVPMSNPDGVMISQSGTLNEEQMLIYETDKRLGYTTAEITEYARQWKANGKGVDLNRNFAAGWDDMHHRDEASCSLYKGEAANDQNESRALVDYTEKYQFAATISYHSSGCVIYYNYGTREDIIADAYDLAKAVEVSSGYTAITDRSLDAGGFKDWAMEVMGIPSITIEIGCKPAPNNFKELYTTYERNKNILPAVAQWVKRYKN